MKKRLYLSILAGLVVLCWPQSLHAQFYDETYALQGIALGSQSVTLSNGFSAMGNPATISQAHKMEVSMSIINRFMLTDLQLMGCGFSYRFTKSDALGIVVQYDGTMNLNQKNMALGYSKKINERFSAGLTLIYLNTFERTIGSRNNVLAKAGASIQPIRDLRVGVSVYNPFAARLTKLTTERIPTIISSGICYTVSKQLKVYSEYKLGFNTLRNLKIGLCYSPKPAIEFFAGIQNTSMPLACGFSLHAKTINVNIAMQYHQVLGYSPAVGFEFY
jgi:hypothetical protein